MKRIKYFISLLKESFAEFSNDNVLKLSAALSYYTIFSLAPMLLLIISIVSFFFGREAFEGQLYGQLKGLLGKDAAAQIQELIKNAAITDKSTTAAVIGGVTLLIGATGVFAEIQDSINYIWAIKAKPKKGWLAYLKNRLLSFSLIITLGFLLVVSLGVNAAVDLLSGRLERYFSEVSVIFFSVLNVALVLIVIAALFAVIFKVLPDGHVRWKECLIGAAFTSVMFAIGKFAITFYLGNSDLGAAYGASASIVILLTWIYYSSIILYFGAEFTKVFAKSDGHHIHPNEHAVLLVRQEFQTEVPQPGVAGAAVKETADETKEAVKDAFTLNPIAMKNKLVEAVTKFIDEKIDAVRAEIQAAVSKVISPAIYYAVIAVIGLCLIISVMLIAGHFLNQWFNSDYLGYVVLLGFMILLLVLHILFRKQFQAVITKLFFALGKEK